jgi:2-hydroxychromene-2-carboxylate isomerase
MPTYRVGMASSPDLEFFFDPICPFAWVTSRWVVEVAQQRDVAIEWKFIALAIVNEDTDYSKFPPAYPSLHGLGRRLLRVAAAARAEGGNDAVAALYTAAGERMHHDGVSVAVFGGEPIPENLVAEVVAAAGLDASLVAAADDEHCTPRRLDVQGRGLDIRTAWAAAVFRSLFDHAVPFGRSLWRHTIPLMTNFDSSLPVLPS